MKPSYLSATKGNVETRAILLPRWAFEERFTEDFASLPERFAKFPEGVRPTVIDFLPDDLGLIFTPGEALDSFIEYCEKTFTPIVKG